MANSSIVLEYKLPEMIPPKKASDIPLSPKKLEKWLADLPLLNVNQLSFSIPKYIEQLNEVNISDKDRFAMLEQLRPVVAHLYTALTKRFSRRNLDLSKESQEIQWLTGKLIHGMSIGYQRLLSNVAKKKIGILNRGQYTVLAQRTMYYLSERIRLSYMLCCEAPKGAWHELNTTYAHTASNRVTASKLKDNLAYFDEKGTIETLYNRILLLSMVSPYSLRGAELEQIYFGLSAWASLIQLGTNTSSAKGSYAIGFDDDYGPIFYPTIEYIANKNVIDNSHLLRQLKIWKDSGDSPESFDQKGMSNKLLVQVIDALEEEKVESEEQYGSSGEPVEIVMGLQNIDSFLEHIDSLVKDDDVNSPIPKVNTKESELNVENIGWDTLQFYTPTNNDQPTSARQVSARKQVKQKKATDELTVRRHKFTVENESRMGACISCNNLHGNGLFIGEMMFIRGYEPETWTLGVVRWMRISGNKLKVGLYLLSAQVDSVVVTKEGEVDDLIVNALWMAEGEEHNNTLLLPRAEFRIGDQLQLKHHDEELFVTLGETLWSSEGFAQFTFSVEQLEEEDFEFAEEYLMPA